MATRSAIRAHQLDLLNQVGVKALPVRHVAARVLLTRLGCLAMDGELGDSLSASRLVGGSSTAGGRNGSSRWHHDALEIAGFAAIKGLSMERHSDSFLFLAYKSLTADP